MLRHCFTVIAILFILSTALFAAPNPLPDDPNLDKPVTLGIKGEALSDIARMLEKQSGAQLRVTKEIADQKATIFVDEKPLRDVMLALETLFGFRWSVKTVSGKRVYELWMTDKTRKEREAGWDAALNKAWNDADAQIKLVASLSTKTPEELQKMIDEQNKKLTDEALFNILNCERPMGTSGSAARLYSTAPQSVRDALMAGCRVYYDTESFEPEWRIPNDIAKSLKETDRDFITDGMAADNIDLRLSAEITYQGLTINYRYIGTLGSSTLIGNGNLCDAMPIAELSTMNHLPHAPIDPILKKETTFTADELISEAAIPRQQKPSSWIYATMSDVLSLLHRKLGLQIISDYYSDWTWGDNTNAISTDKRLDQAQMHSPPYCWGWDGKYLFVRSTIPHYMDAREIPNRILRPLQDVFKQQGWLGIDELAQIASLSDEQLRCIIDNERFLRLSTDDSKIAGGEEIAWNGPSSWVSALRFYNSLAPAQKKQTTENGISVVSLNATQRGYLVDILLMRGGNAMPDRYTFPVGIWKNGVRIDKPDVSHPSDPVSVAFHQDEPNQFIFETSTSESSTCESFPAASVNEARETIFKSNPEAKKGKGRLYQQIGYIMVITFGDGKQIDISIPIKVPQRIN